MNEIPEMSVIKGDLLLVNRGFIIHGCNMQGVMGSGVALAVRNMYPSAFTVYSEHMRSNPKLGQISVDPISSNLYVVNALTQEYYGSDKHFRYVDYDAVYNAFCNVLTFAKVVDPMEVLPLCFPMIGAGLGNGDWTKITDMIDMASRAISSKRERHLYVI